jgi:L-asparaginase
MARFEPGVDFRDCVTAIAGQGGELERSAGDRFGKTGEGDGGIIGIERIGARSQVVFDFNCGGMFRAWVDETGNHKFMVFKDDY